MADPTQTTFVEPASARTLREWTPALLKTARAQADAGNLELAADFCESAMGDDRVQAALSTRTKGLISLPISFEAAKGTKRLVKALEAGEDWWASYPSTELGQLLAWGILLGVGLGQNVWTMRSSVERLVPVLKVWHPRHLRYDWNRRIWTVKVDGNKVVDVTPGDGTWILYTPYGTSRPWAFGVWRAIAMWQLLKQYAIEDWGEYSDKTGRGNLVASTPEAGWTREKRKELAADLFGISGNATIALPPGVTLEMIEATASNWATFEAQKNAADLGIAVAIVGQNLSTEVSGPASTGATLHGKVMQVFVDADAETFSTCIHDQSLVWWAEFNFGSRDIAPWPVWDTKPPADKAAYAAVLKTVSETLGSLINAGAPVDMRALLERFDVPLLKPEDIKPSGQVFKYHLDYGVLTLNEIRERLGLPPVPHGDVAPVPMSAAPVDPKINPDSPDAQKALQDLIVRLELIESSLRRADAVQVAQYEIVARQLRAVDETVASLRDRHAGLARLIGEQGEAVLLLIESKHLELSKTLDQLPAAQEQMKTFICQQIDTDRRALSQQVKQAMAGFTELLHKVSAAQDSSQLKEQTE